jgi:hypothetical protein
MTTVEVFDPPMCCSTGVCGPSVDPVLARFAADLDWLAGQGVSVSRATLSQEPEKFVACPPVRDALYQGGNEALPALVVDGRLRCAGRYPSRAELGEWASLPAARVSVAVPVAVRSDADGGCCGGGGNC